MRDEASILHVDLDSFFAAVEQRDKPSLRGKPVIVGGVGGRGVVATASYEARVHGVRSAMSTAEARRRCPHAAFLSPRFPAYKAASELVMAQLRELSGLVEQVSIDEAYADLSVPADPDLPLLAAEALSVEAVTAQAAELRARIAAVTGGLTASVGLGPSKSIAKLASEAAKPDGLLAVPGEHVRAFLDPLPVRAIGGAGPATVERLRRVGIESVAQLAAADEADLVSLLGSAHGRGLWLLARGIDERPVVPVREAKSVSAEETFPTDLRDPAAMGAEIDLLAARVGARLRREGTSGRTVTLKMRFADFTTRTRSSTSAAALDDPRAIARVARRLLSEVDTMVWSSAGGVRLLGVGVSGLADWVQEDLLADEPAPSGKPSASGEPSASDEVPAIALTSSDVPRAAVEWRPGADVAHTSYGPGWVWGSGLGRVTVRFEGPGTAPGPVRTFRADDPELTPADPPPLPGAQAPAPPADAEG